MVGPLHRVLNRLPRLGPRWKVREGHATAARGLPIELDGRQRIVGRQGPIKPSAAPVRAAAY